MNTSYDLELTNEEYIYKHAKPAAYAITSIGIYRLSIGIQY